MKTVILTVSLFLAANSWAGNSLTGEKTADKQIVYVSTTNNVKTYHSKINCCGMFFVHDNVTCTKQEAEKEGMEPCKRCFGKTTGKLGNRPK
jgi:hypothetical protein